MYNQYKDEKAEGYTKDTWKVFQEALQNAQSVIENEQADQKVVDEALTQLQNAVCLLYTSSIPIISAESTMEQITQSCGTRYMHIWTAIMI